MNKKITVWIIWFVIAVAACSISLFVAGLFRQEATGLPRPRPDAIVTSTVSKENVLMKNETAGYAITVPRDWYLEKSAGSGLTVYPNYEMTGGAMPSCKIEISALQNPDRKDLASWLTAYLWSDPTADVLQTSRMTTTVGGVPAIIWRGVLNEVTTTLAYIATGAAVYEIAPTAVAASGNDALISVDCESALSIVLKNFEFLK